MQKKSYYHPYFSHSAHCNYLNMYISQKIRLRVFDLEDQFQTTLQAKDIKFMIWKFNSITYLFSFSFYFLQKFQIQCFLHTFDAIPKSWNTWIAIWRKNVTQMIQPFGNSINSVQKALDLTTPAKNRAKMSIIDLNFQIKEMIGLVRKLTWTWPCISTKQNLIFREM